MQKRKEFEKILIIIIIFLIPLFSNMIFTNPLNQNSKIYLKTENLKNSRVEYHLNNSWIDNPTFEGTGDPWESRVEGDTRDVLGSISSGQANYGIIGDKGYLEIDDPLNNTDWELNSNPDLPIMPNQFSNITEEGCVVSHSWDEDVNQTHNRPSAQWKRTINMGVDMRDYIITDAFLEVYFNATVTVSPWNAGGIDRENDTGLDDYSTGDYAEFYVLLSDVEETFPTVRVAYNHTGDLGRDGTSGTYPDTPLNIVPKNVLKSVLSSILGTDGYNFTITLGIDIYCEDNELGVDIDTWNSLIIRSFNLTFSYEKKIDQLTTIGWEQAGNTITGTNVQITDANLIFNYKIDRLWPEVSSPNSEIRILLNNNSHSETIKLSEADTSFQSAKEGGFDVTSLILKNVNITLSIQVYLADEFGLDQNITISIDGVYLTISYVEIFYEFFNEPWVFAALLVFAIVATAGLGGYFIAYQRILKYPRPVRKVMKYRRTLRRTQEPEVVIIPRDVGFTMAYNHEIASTSKTLKIKPIGSKEPISMGKGTLEKPSDKILAEKIDSEELITKSLEKKGELDELVKDSLGEASKTDKS
ncbi:MAG: hypothetical protein ACFFB9_13930 [Promethearchaeota archaeon]